LISRNLSNSGSAGGNFLPATLPVVRMEVACPASWADLVSGLRASGFTVLLEGDLPPDATVVRVSDGSLPAAGEKLPFVAIARGRCPQALAATIESGASGYFVAPFDFVSLSATLCALAARMRTNLPARSAKARDSLTDDQAVSTVVGILMERYRIQRTEAYERLRRYSRTERRKVVEVATQIVTATEELSRTMRAIESVARVT